jgi:hypothetical protein
VKVRVVKLSLCTVIMRGSMVTRPFISENMGVCVVWLSLWTGHYRTLWLALPLTLGSYFCLSVCHSAFSFPYIILFSMDIENNNQFHHGLLLTVCIAKHTME